MRRAIVRPRTQGEPTAVGEVLAALPLAARSRDAGERRELRRQSGIESTFGPGFYTLVETANMASAAEEYIVDQGVLTKGGKLLLYAAPGVGKTTMLDHLGACIASGSPFLGRFAVDQPRQVLFVQGELAAPELASHGQQLLDRFRGTEAEHNLVFSLRTQLKLPRDYDTIRAAVLHTGAEVLILDPFIRFYNGENSTQPEEVSRLFECIDRLLEDRELNVQAAVVAHHMNVAGLRTAGSWAFEAWPSTIVRLDAVKGRRNARSLSFVKVRSPESILYGQRLTVVLGEDGYLAESDFEGGSGPDGQGVIRLVAFLRGAGGEAWRKDAVAYLTATLGVKERQTTNIIGAAVRAGAIRSVPVGREARLVVDDAEAD